MNHFFVDIHNILKLKKRNKIVRNSAWSKRPGMPYIHILIQLWLIRRWSKPLSRPQQTGAPEARHVTQRGDNSRKRWVKRKTIAPVQTSNNFSTLSSDKKINWCDQTSYIPRLLPRLPPNLIFNNRIRINLATGFVVNISAST